eukprot:TRINITY_DN2722_c1_g1_i1.p1 TRINITY_DN2722_c1_g1~~TRINITY_DN2722_c1_g1_i1.p1  ORF type:complete len:501 (+),score=156.74 TRINITY_DN2722_c1_g1_i1:125-1627(+)
MVEKRKGTLLGDGFDAAPICLSPVAKKIGDMGHVVDLDDEQSTAGLIGVVPNCSLSHRPTALPQEDDAKGSKEKKPDPGTWGIYCMTMFNFAYGCICTTMGLFILPAESVRLFPEDESMALGGFLLVVGVSQLICPYTGLVSDRCTSKLGRRRPYILAGTAIALMSVSLMHYSSLNYYRWAFAGFLFIAMLALNVIFSAQCSLVPDLVAESRQGAASGIVAVQQLMGSFSGFLLVMFSNNSDIHMAYFLYQVLLTSVVFVVCVSSHEVPLDSSKVAAPTAREILKSYTIDTVKDIDFFWVFVSRTFFYGAVSCQAFMMFYIRDVVGTKDEGQARSQMAAIAMIGQVTAACVAFPVGRISDTTNMSRKAMIYFACFMMTIVYVLFVTVPLVFPKRFVIPGVYCVAAIYGVGNGCYLAVDYALALDVIPSKATAGQDLGVWGIAAFIGSSVGPMIWGLILKLTGKSSNQDEYLFRGYVFMLLGGCIASFASGWFVKYVKGSR